MNRIVLSDARIRKTILFCLLIFTSLACRLMGVFDQSAPAPTQIAYTVEPPLPVVIPTPRIHAQRLEVTYLGLDGNKLIGSGCPGNFDRGTIIDHHFSISGVHPFQEVTRIMVMGDNSTLTWSLPCSDTWELYAMDTGNGDWDVLIAPSDSSHTYTVLFFFSDNSIALGMTTVP